MDAPLIITIFAMALVVAVTAGLWARSRGARPMMGGIGVLLIPLGLYLLGMTRLAYNGVISLIDWAQRTTWTQTMTWGATLVGVGLLLFVVSRFIKPAVHPSPAEKQARPAVTPQQSAGRPATTAVAATGPQTGGTAGKPAAKTAEDAEVEDILRKRGLL